MGWDGGALCSSSSSGSKSMSRGDRTAIEPSDLPHFHLCIVWVGTPVLLHLKLLAVLWGPEQPQGMELESG